MQLKHPALGWERLRGANGRQWVGAGGEVMGIGGSAMGRLERWNRSATGNQAGCGTGRYWRQVVLLP
jgi:hypothetical protein